MNDDLRTFCTASLRRQLSATHLADGGDAEGAPEDAVGADAAATPPPPPQSPPTLDLHAVREFMEGLTVRDNPGLKSESAHALVVAADAIQNVAIASLMDQLKSDDQLERTKAGAVVQEFINSDSEFRRSLILGPIVQGVMGDDTNLQRKRTNDVYWILRMRPDPPVQKLVETGIILRVVEFLNEGTDRSLQREAARVLADFVAAGGIEHTNVIVNAGAISAFVRLLRSPDEEMQYYAALGLANIVAIAPDQRDPVLHSGAVQLLVDVALRHRGPELFLPRAIAQAFGNLCNPLPTFALVRPALPAMARLLSYEDEIVLHYVGIAFDFLMCGTDDEIQEVVDVGVCPRFVHLLRHPNIDVQRIASRVVDAVLASGDRQMQAILDENPLPSLRVCLSSPDGTVHGCACSAIANILSLQSQERVQEVIDVGILPSLIQLLASSTFIVWKEAVRAMYYFSEFGAPDQIQALVGAGVIPGLCGAFAVIVEAPERVVIHWALSILEHLLLDNWDDSQPGDLNPVVLSLVAVRPMLEGLQRHQEDEIRNHSCHVLELLVSMEAASNEATDADTDGS